MSAGSAVEVSPYLHAGYGHVRANDTDAWIFRDRIRKINHF